MQHDTTYATTLAALREPAREDAASARGRLGRFWDRTMARIARYRPQYELAPRNEDLRRDIGLAGADAPRSFEREHAWRMSAHYRAWDSVNAISRKNRTAPTNSPRPPQA